MLNDRLELMAPLGRTGRIVRDAAGEGLLMGVGFEVGEVKLMGLSARNVKISGPDASGAGVGGLGDFARVVMFGEAVRSGYDTGSGPPLNGDVNRGSASSELMICGLLGVGEVAARAASWRDLVLGVKLTCLIVDGVPGRLGRALST